MDNKRPLSFKMRIIHRYLGFFLAGIMAIYAVSGIILVFRRTNFLKQNVKTERVIAANLAPEAVGEALKIKDFEVKKTEGDVISFGEANTYNLATGEVVTYKKQYGYVVDKIVHLHKATTNDPMYYLNIFFGLSLLFFVISAFWMYLPDGKILRKGLIFTAGGIILTLIMLFV
ncbi:PepSY domain-containing protein [Neolewinella aurantiaca]|uniref:PepSY domain-containing protein n=1 Tax=Neolewinella aurantiaca TaxID=2602767 RepID=A0A5C7F5K9_9BACT|nr:PepSY domain-containing protein [Neolewinella aurantiaca]TXF85991.1 PepSY domain-containing protein [Neolewinella aurantiaca]